MNGTQIMITILGTMLAVEIALTVWIGFFLGRVATKMAADDAAIFLQGRTVASVVKEMHEYLEENLKKSA